MRLIPGTNSHKFKMSEKYRRMKNGFVSENVRDT